VTLTYAVSAIQALLILNQQYLSPCRDFNTSKHVFVILVVEAAVTYTQGQHRGQAADKVVEQLHLSERASLRMNEKRVG